MIVAQCAAEEAPDGVLPDGANYVGSNFLLGRIGGDFYLQSNRSPESSPEKLGDGVHVVSNDVYGDRQEWPKVKFLRDGVQAIMADPPYDIEELVNRLGELMSTPKIPLDNSPALHSFAPGVYTDQADLDANQQVFVTSDRYATLAQQVILQTVAGEVFMYAREEPNWQWRRVNASL
jgi:uncharacterized protein with NRDE domain